MDKTQKAAAIVAAKYIAVDLATMGGASIYTSLRAASKRQSAVDSIYDYVGREEKRIEEREEKRADRRARREESRRSKK